MNSPGFASGPVNGPTKPILMDLFSDDFNDNITTIYSNGYIKNILIMGLIVK